MLYHSHWISFLNVANAALTAFVLRVAILARLLNHKRYLPGPPQMEMAAIWVDAMPLARLPRLPLGTNRSRLADHGRIRAITLLSPLFLRRRDS
jgi:hypothetical protein